MSIEITAGSPAFSAEVRLPRSAAISGHVADELGDPIELAQVSAERIIRTDGRASTITMAIATTDDLGEYRLDGLPEGAFVVSGRQAARNDVRFTVVDGRPVAERPDGTPARGYYPGVAMLSQAQPVDVRAGEEHSSIDFTIVQYRQVPARIRLAFVDENGKPMLATSTLVSLDDASGGTAINTSSVGDNVMQRVEPGRWLLVARGMYGPGVAAVPIDVGSTDISMSVPLRRGGRIVGRVVTDRGSPPTDAVDIEARAVDAAVARMPGPPPVARARAGETFMLTDLIGTREFRIRSAPKGWVVKAILAAGRDLLDVPVEFKAASRSRASKSS
jgi:hypothetical protein